MTFQSVVLIIAIVVLIICLILIGMALNKSKKEKQFPPVLPDCPDYWETVLSQNPDEDGNRTIVGCKNVRGLGNCDKDQVNSTIISLNPCSKKKWAKSCDISWDGITNADPCGSNNEEKK